MNWEQASELCDEILRMIEEDIDEKARDRGIDFFDQVEEKVKNMQEWIDEKQHVTAKMISALESMKAGVANWIK